MSDSPQFIEPGTFILEQRACPPDPLRGPASPRAAKCKLIRNFESPPRPEDLELDRGRTYHRVEFPNELVKTTRSPDNQ
jgi:hypothetical protein